MKLKHVFVTGYAALAVLFGCSEQESGRLPSDPDGSFVTSDKKVLLQQKRTFSFQDAGVWVSNEFSGGRLDDLTQVNDSVYTALMVAENAPINNSAWYAFKVWGDKKRKISFNLTYKHGTHRYHPKISRDAENWVRLDSVFYAPDTANGTASMKLEIGSDTVWVAGQELIVSKDFEQLVERFSAHSFVTKSIIGTSKLGKPLQQLQITEAENDRNNIVIIGRQHPPEVTGTIGLVAFLETICGDTELAQTFRKRFNIIAIPLVNPDGVDNGHWRHNAAGVDLNRDWAAFNQPETRALRDEMLKIANDPARNVYLFLDFHSTWKDIFYSMSKDLKTKPADFTDRWLARIKETFPDYEITERPSAAVRPISKNWFYNTFKCPSITYEFGDRTDRELIRKISTGAAVTMMELLLDDVR